MEKYILKTKRDTDILNSCKKLEKLKLSKKEKDLVALIKTQFERNWRKHLLTALNKIFKKCNQTKK